jgi:hypothetical protein
LAGWLLDHLDAIPGAYESASTAAVRCRPAASYVSKTFEPVATVALAERAVANLDHLILTRSLPATTRARVRA